MDRWPFCERGLQDRLAQSLGAGEGGGDLCLGDADQREAAIGFRDDSVLFSEGRDAHRGRANVFEVKRLSSNFMRSGSHAIDSRRIPKPKLDPMR